MRPFIKYLAFVAVLAASDPVWAANDASDQNISGRAFVIDGDTIKLDKRKIRLEGLDAPELDQKCTKDGKKWACGKAARKALQNKLQGKTVRCTLADKKSYGRHLGVCHVAGENLNAWLVEQGWAVIEARYDKQFAAEEESARTAKRGVWAGRFKRPCVERGSCRW